jgi:hypothetical protein
MAVAHGNQHQRSAPRTQARQPSQEHHQRGPRPEFEPAPTSTSTNQPFVVCFLAHYHQPPPPRRSQTVRVPASRQPPPLHPSPPKVRLFPCLGCIADILPPVGRASLTRRALIDQIIMNFLTKTVKTVKFLAKGPKAWFRRDPALDGLDGYNFDYVVKKDVVAVVLDRDEKENGWVAIEAQAF